MDAVLNDLKAVQVGGSNGGTQPHTGSQTRSCAFVLLTNTYHRICLDPTHGPWRARRANTNTNGNIRVTQAHKQMKMVPLAAARAPADAVQGGVRSNGGGARTGTFAAGPRGGGAWRHCGANGKHRDARGSRRRTCCGHPRRGARRRHVREGPRRHHCPSGGGKDRMRCLTLRVIGPSRTLTCLALFNLLVRPGTYRPARAASQLRARRSSAGAMKWRRGWKARGVRSGHVCMRAIPCLVLHIVLYIMIRPKGASISCGRTGKPHTHRLVLQGRLCPQCRSKGNGNRRRARGGAARP